MPEPLVSVVIPAYEHAQFIEQAVGSVLDQPLPPGGGLEVIVVDDGSGDDTLAVATRLARSDPRVLVLHQDNQGAHAAINNGLARARGRWLTILNSDDFYRRGRLSALLGAARSGGAEILFSQVEHVDERGDPLPVSHPAPCEYLRARRQARGLPTLGYALLQFNLAVSTGNLFFSRALHRRIGPFRALRLCHDWDFLLRALLESEPTLLEEPLLSYRIHGRNSFQQLGALSQRETLACLSNYLRQALRRTPRNPLAPSPQHWPRFFDWYADRIPVLASSEELAMAMTPDAEPGPVGP